MCSTTVRGSIGGTSSPFTDAGAAAGADAVAGAVADAAAVADAVAVAVAGAAAVAGADAVATAGAGAAAACVARCAAGGAAEAQADVNPRVAVAKSVTKFGRCMACPAGPHSKAHEGSTAKIRPAKGHAALGYSRA